MTSKIDVEKFYENTNRTQVKKEHVTRGINALIRSIGGDVTVTSYTIDLKRNYTLYFQSCDGYVLLIVTRKSFKGAVAALHLRMAKAAKAMLVEDYEFEK